MQFNFEMNMKLQMLIIFMLHLCFAAQYDVVHYIVPKSPSVCPVHSCLTLSEFVMNANTNSSTIVVFLPGYHTLTSTVYVANVTRFSMISSSLLQKPVIMCQQNKNFVFDEIGQITIRRLIFVGCGSNRVLSCPHFTIANSTFNGHNGSGTALELIDTNAKIYNSSFAFNVIGSYRGLVKIFNYYWKGTLNFTKDYFAYVGGALIVNSSNVTLVACVFQGNMAQVGGAIYSTMGSNISMLNCIFVKNFAAQHFDYNLPAFGGALHCENDIIMVETVNSGYIQ